MSRHNNTTKEFICKAKNVHGVKYDYSLVKYINSKTKVEIICPLHGTFSQVPAEHCRGQGCSICGYIKTSAMSRKNNDWFIKRATESHGNKYDYSLVDYQGALAKVKIVCPLHGVFEQVARDHYVGFGCRVCNQNIDYVAYYKNSIEGKNLGIIYCLKFTNIKTQENFYKIGITKHSIKLRFNTLQYKPFNIEEVEIIQISNYNCALVERHIMNVENEHKYTPKLKFDGHTECYSVPINLTKHLNIIKRTLT